jgi:diguanylate cyclase (GGDEF)-like protein
MVILQDLDQRLDRCNRAEILAMAVLGLLVVGGVDFITGFEISVSVFYLGPLALAAWYAGRGSGIIAATLASIFWFIADFASGHPYSHQMIAIWNALVLFGLYIITATLISKLRQSLCMLQTLAQTDVLTGLYNRREFNTRLGLTLAYARRHDSVFSVAYIDVDDFKAVNDSKGHTGGDRVLQTIANVLKHSIRSYDTAARLGGDEFSLLLPDLDHDAARHFITKISYNLKQVPELNDWGISCSIGVVTFQAPEISPERALASADELMYQVKHKGKGAIEFSVYKQAAGQAHTLH